MKAFKIYNKLFFVFIVLILLTSCNNTKNQNDDVDAGNMITAMPELKENEQQETEGTEKEGEEVLNHDSEKDFNEIFQNLTLEKGYKSSLLKNPLITQRYTADPYAMVYNDRVYVYATHDAYVYDTAGNIKTNEYGTIRSLNCISSDDLVNWTDHGVITVGGSGSVTAWANNSWAPAAAYKNIDGVDRFFLYFANSAGSIGVLSSDNPEGPWIDPLGKPLITKETENCSDVVWCFDPAVLMDDDGSAYLYFGGGIPDGKEDMPNTARAVKLSDDMISLAGVPVVIEAPWIFEDSGINKINGIYYYSYCTNWNDRFETGGVVPDKAVIAYMTSSSPLGPWTYQGTILKNPGNFFGVYGNNHHSMIQFHDKWYMFYHTQYLDKLINGSAKDYRATHVNEVSIDENGVIQDIKADQYGVEQIKYVDPYQWNEAETIGFMGGISTVDISSDNNTNMAVKAVNGSWLAVAGVDFTDTAAHSFTTRVASKDSGGIIKLCLDSVEGEAIGYLEVPGTEQEDALIEITITITGCDGVHDLYFVFAGEEIIFDNWMFTKID